MKNVSFIIPNYNAENTIGKTIESIQKQRYKGKIEIIVVDDNSKDNSIKVISKYKKVKLIKNEKNLGLAKSLNKAIKSSNYDLLAILWCDCVLETNNWLNEMIKKYNSNKNCFVGSKLIIPKEYWDKFSFYDKVVLAKDYEISLKDKQKEGRPTLFSKKLLLKANLYDEKIFRIAGEDTDLRWKIQELGYRLITAKVNILHLHGFYNLSFKKHLINKALPLAEASGVNFRKHGIKSLSSKYWNPITSTILYFSLLIPYLNFLSLILILFLTLKYTINSFKYAKDIRIILIPFFKLFKDILTIIGFWKGYLTGKQEF
jgi:glycosyltransferase involved in cell wall biosynthesis